MDVDFPFDEAVRFSDADDDVHPPGPKRDWTETTWWSFHVAERSLAGWLYVQMRPHLGTASGGAFVYDPAGWLPWQLPYFGYTQFQAMPDPLDLRAATFPNGVSVACEVPGRRYRLGYRFRDQTEFVADLVFEGVIPPVPHLQGAPPFTASSHYDQPGRVTGTIELWGERIAVDCVSVRDRSWGRRPEMLGTRTHLSYAFGSSSPGDAFLAFCAPPKGDPHCDVERLTSGYLYRDGCVRRLASATRRVTRDPGTGGVRQVEISGADTDGRPLEAFGTARSRMVLPGSTLCINTFLQWDLGGDRGWGEDQDVWSVAALAERFSRVVA